MNRTPFLRVFFLHPFGHHLDWMNSVSENVISGFEQCSVYKANTNVWGKLNAFEFMASWAWLDYVMFILYTHPVNLCTCPICLNSRWRLLTCLAKWTENLFITCRVGESVILSRMLQWNGLIIENWKQIKRIYNFFQNLRHCLSLLVEIKHGCEGYIHQFITKKA